jgi:acetyl-CoA carboxylase biotin carboxylase subunit
MDAGITFIGPTPENINAMGDKLSAKALMKKAKVPTVPGSDGAVESVEQAAAVVKSIGLPVIIKASAGGGGKGMRVVRSESEIESAFRACRSEGQNYFKDPTVYIEKFVSDPNTLKFKCSATNMAMSCICLNVNVLCKDDIKKLLKNLQALRFHPRFVKKWATLQFERPNKLVILAPVQLNLFLITPPKNFYFMEMNTRLQVEHPITELVTGVDLVREQIFVALGHPLSFKQEDLKQKGHAIEVRICAEDPVTYKPSPGLIRACRHPQGPFVRCDSYAYPGYEVPIYYDPMIAKVITWGETRAKKLLIVWTELCQSLFYQELNRTYRFTQNDIKTSKIFDGSYTTQFLEKNFEVIEPEMFKYIDDHVFLIAAAITAYNDRKAKDVRQYNVYPNWKRLGRRMQLRL